MPTQQQNALMQRLQSMRPGARQAPASQISKPIGAGGQGVPPSQDGAQLRQLQQQLVGQSAVNPQRTPPLPQQQQRLRQTQPMVSQPVHQLGNMPAGYIPGALQRLLAQLQGDQMQGLGSAPMGTGGQGMPAFGGMGDMGGQMQGLGPAPMGTGGQGMPAFGAKGQMGPNMGTSLGGMGVPQVQQPMGGFGPNVNNFGGPSPSPGPYTPGMQVPLSPYNTTTQQNIMGGMGSAAPQIPSTLGGAGSLGGGLASLMGQNNPFA